MSFIILSNGLFFFPKVFLSKSLCLLWIPVIFTEFELCGEPKQKNKKQLFCLAMG